MVFKFIPGDVGRLITDISSELDYPALAEQALAVLRILAFHEEQVPIRGNQWYRVRNMPYRTLNNQIGGVVITFTDITASRMLESQLRTVQAGLDAHIPIAPLITAAETPPTSTTSRES